MQRQKDAEHAKGMGVSVKTGRKLPTKTMTSTQRSLAQMRGMRNEEREPSGRFGQSVHDYKIKMNSRVAKSIKKSGPVHDTRDNPTYKAAHAHLQATGKKHGVQFDKLHHDITGHYAMAKPGQDKDKVHKALTDYEKTVGKHVK
jgi:hypothetical protein